MRAVDGYDHSRANELSDHIYKTSSCLSVFKYVYYMHHQLVVGRGSVCGPAVLAISLKRFPGLPSDPHRHCSASFPCPVVLNHLEQRRSPGQLVFQPNDQVS